VPDKERQVRRLSFVPGASTVDGGFAAAEAVATAATATEEGDTFS
jgi:hypothetical protein